MERSDQNTALMDQFVRAHGKTLEKFVTQIVHDHGAAQQLVQQLYLDVFARLSSSAPAPIEFLRAYLFTVARRRAIKFLRKQASGPQFVADQEEADRVPDPTADPERAAAIADALRVLNEALGAMPDKRRTVFMLDQWEGLSRTEIAAQTGMSVDAVDKHMARSLKSLRKTLQASGLGKHLFGWDGDESETP